MPLTTMKPPVMRLNAAKRKETHVYRRPATYFSGIFCGTKYKLPEANVIAVDLDGTLAKSMAPYDPRRIGPPLIPKDRKLLRQSAFYKTKHWIKQGKKIVILTARVNSTSHTPEQLKYTYALIKAWCKKHLGKVLPITSEKHHSMAIILDDRGVHVDRNTGRLKL